MAMIFVTACDDNYFVYVLAQIMAIDRYFDQYPVIYNLGLDAKNISYLKDLEICVLPKPHAPEPGNNYPNGYQPMALWKPIMLLDAALRYGEDIVYMDADAKPVCEFEFPSEELGLVKVEDWNGSRYTGPYHSGVMFLGKSKGRILFLLEWAKDLWNDDLPSDKKSLNRVLRYLDAPLLQLFPAREYNARKMYQETKILHQKRLA